jgi:hypothetical protein
MNEASRAGRRRDAVAHATNDHRHDSGVTRYIDHDIGPPPTGAWTPARVEERLRKAVALREKLHGCDTELAPEGESMGIIGGIGVNADGDVVVAAATEALSWLRWLDADDAGIVAARLQGTPWKLICWRFDISRPTADRRWRYALAVIAWRLNGHAASRSVPSLRSLLQHHRASGPGRETFLGGTGR